MLTRISPVILVLLALGPATVPGVSSAAGARSNPVWSSSRALMLKPSALPTHFRYQGIKVIDSVLDWDQNIKPIVQIDIRNGWLEAAEEFAQDGTKHDVGLSVQLFRSNSGALADFGQFFTNSHPETIYIPGAHW